MALERERLAFWRARWHEVERALGEDEPLAPHVSRSLVLALDAIEAVIERIREGRDGGGAAE